MRTTDWRARLAAGAFLFLALVRPNSAAELRVAAERPDAACPAGGRVLGIVPLAAGEGAPAAAGAPRCLILLSVADLSDGALDDAAARLSRLSGTAAVVLDFSPVSGAVRDARLPLAVKKLSSAARSSSSPAPLVALDLPAAAPGGEPLPGDLGLAPYADAVAVRPGRPPAVPEEVLDAWLLVPRGAEGGVVRDILNALGERPFEGANVTLVGLLGSRERPVTDADWRSLERLQAYWTRDVSRDPTATSGRRAGGETFAVPRFFDAKKFTPILLVPENAGGRVEIELSGGSYERASVENLETGARRDFEVRGAKTLALDPSRGSLAVVLQPVQRKGGDSKTSVEVGAARGLTAEEIVARERAWDAGQRERVQSFIAHMDASLRFRIGEVNETFDLTIRGPFFFRRGEPADWEWDEFYLNGVKWKGKTLPKLPILQPEKVTTLPLDIRLTEDYDYVLRGEARVGDRRAYQITYQPKTTVGDRPIYHGTVWIDVETFALLRREAIQLNLKGETLSNIQNEYYRPVPEHPEFVLPLEIRGQQVFSTAGRTTAIERNVVMTRVAVNPVDFDKTRAAAYASPAQMIRDTERGMRYLIPDPAAPGARIVEEKISKKSTFGLIGSFYDDSLDYPLPLLGVQHFNFDLWGKGKQISVFFGGALLTTNFTDPSLFGSRFDLGADLFAVAFASGDVAYRDGKEVPGEKIKHLPAILQVNLGRPLGPYLKASLGIFTKFDNYQRDKTTNPAFVTPVDTFTDGAELRLVSNFSGFNASLAGGYYRRRKWDPWGDPATSEYDARQKDYWKYSVSLSKDQYFKGFRKLHAGIAYLGGGDLDRFSKYEFGTFSTSPVHGFKSGSLRTESALIANLSYGLNIEDIIRFEAFYDQALLRDKRSGFSNTYFSGAGLLASLNGPWANSLFRADIGIPVVSHGVRGFVVYVLLLKLF